MNIDINDKDFKVLSRWASVSRTLRESMRLLEDYAHQVGMTDDLQEKILHNVDELEQIVQPLDNVNDACKRRFLQEVKHG